MLQGMARGKVGDVVFYRMNGEQMSRVRNRKPRNPKTIAQLYQRAIMGTIIKAYAAGKEIFDHSFQGKRVGEANMRTFLSRNMTLLRNQIAEDINGNVATAQQVGRVVAPKSIYPVPVTNLIISEGTYNNGVVVLTPATSASSARINMPEIEEGGETLAEYASRVGLIPGDIYTIVFFIVDKSEVAYTLDGSNNDYSKQYKCQFGWLRLIVKDIVDDTIVANEALFGDLFNIMSDGNFIYDDLKSTSISQPLSPEELVVTPNAQGTIGLIHSREDVDLRSNSQMVPFSITQRYGLTSSYLLDAWQREIDSLGQSALILEGAGAPNYQTEESDKLFQPFTTTFEMPLDGNSIQGKFINFKTGYTAGGAKKSLRLLLDGEVITPTVSSQNIVFTKDNENIVQFYAELDTNSFITGQQSTIEKAKGGVLFWEK